MGIAVIGLIVLAIVALLAIPLIVAVVGRSTTDEDPDNTGDPEHDPNVKTSEEEEEGISSEDHSGDRK